MALVNALGALALDATLQDVLTELQAQGYDLALTPTAPDAGQVAALVAGARKEVIFSTTIAAAVAVTDVSNYRWGSVHIVAQGTSSSIAFQGSNDGVNWVSIVLMNVASLGQSQGATSATTSGVLFHGPMSYRYFRLNVTGISAGTTSGVIEFFGVSPAPVTGAMAVAGLVSEGSALSGNPVRIAGTDGANLRTPMTRVDNVDTFAPSGTAYSLSSLALAHGYDGTNWARLNAAANADAGQRGLVVANARKEVTFSTTVPAAVASTDASNYRSVSVQITSQGASSATTFQVSNDNVNWVMAGLVTMGTAADTGQGGVGNPSTTGIWWGNLPARYFRINVTLISSGTTAGVVEFSSMPMTPNAIAAYQTLRVMNQGQDFSSTFRNFSVGQDSADGISTSSGFYAQRVLPLQLGYNGASWDRVRTPSITKTITATAAGDTAVWTPTSGKKFRLMRYMIQVTPDAATAGGADVDIVLRDATTGTAAAFSIFAPAVAGSTFGNASGSGWVDLGNGILSAAANNVLNVNLSAALTSGKVRVIVCGTEE